MIPNTQLKKFIGREFWIFMRLAPNARIFGALGSSSVHREEHHLSKLRPCAVCRWMRDTLYANDPRWAKMAADKEYIRLFPVSRGWWTGHLAKLHSTHLGQS